MYSKRVRESVTEYETLAAQFTMQHAARRRGAPASRRGLVSDVASGITPDAQGHQPASDSEASGPTDLEVVGRSSASWYSSSKWQFAPLRLGALSVL